jgi:hypothetical protein
MPKAALRKHNPRLNGRALQIIADVAHGSDRLADAVWDDMRAMRRWEKRLAPPVEVTNLF